MPPSSRSASNTRSIHNRGRGGAQNTAESSTTSANAAARGEHPVSIHSRGRGGLGGANSNPGTTAANFVPSRDTEIASRGGKVARKAAPFSQRSSASVPASNQSTVNGIALDEPAPIALEASGMVTADDTPMNLPVSPTSVNDPSTHDGNVVHPHWKYWHASNPENRLCQIEGSGPVYHSSVFQPDITTNTFCPDCDLELFRPATRRLFDALDDGQLTNPGSGDGDEASFVQGMASSTETFIPIVWDRFLKEAKKEFQTAEQRYPAALKEYDKKKLAWEHGPQTSAEPKPPKRPHTLPLVVGLLRDYLLKFSELGQVSQMPVQPNSPSEFESALAKLILGGAENAEAIGTVQDAAHADTLKGSRVVPGTIAKESVHLDEEDILRVGLLRHHNREGPKVYFAHSTNPVAGTIMLSPVVDFYNFALLDGKRLTPTTRSRRNTAGSSLIQVRYKSEAFVGEVRQILRHIQPGITTLNNVMLVHVSWMKRSNLTPLDGGRFPWDN
ncbi:hypothetical protein K438DRAFT_1768026 [Mycena galopus ATCC 62051]|nr:hypothetical protein K438DRAFT_1768026 [Mycena galopus ATCC 62051]